MRAVLLAALPVLYATGRLTVPLLLFVVLVVGATTVLAEITSGTVPTGGFGGVVGPRAVEDADTRECVVTLFADDEAGVDALARRAQEAGGAIVSEPGAQPWAYTATFTDPDGRLWSVMRA